MAQRDSGYERISGDRYFTPAWVMQAVMASTLISTPKFVLDPCAGAGHLLLPFQEVGCKVKGFDIQPDHSLGMEIVKQDTLLGGIGQHKPDLIVMNPPYGARGKLAMWFIETYLDWMKAQSEAGHESEMLVLLPVDFDSAITRTSIFKEHPYFAAKITLLNRLRWANVVQGDNGPSTNHALFLWDSTFWRTLEERSYTYLAKRK